MVIVHVIGGLGNQLFQYAAGRAIAEKHKVPLKLDLADFKNYDVWNFDLAQLNTHFEVATPAEVAALKPSSNFAKALQYLKPKKARIYHREHFFHYDKSFRKIGQPVYLKGYFQSCKYFEPINDILRQEFVINPQKIANIQTIAGEMASSESVSVHIRRGDYVNKEVLKRHGVLDPAYYTTAIRLIEEKVSNPVFYFFSDDIQWVQDNLQVKNAVYVSGKLSSTHFEDLHLMSYCKHNIIANSSFSWWGAWLNNNPGKIVIGPKKWFNHGPKDTYDILPKDWIEV